MPANFIERRQSVKEITCDLIQVARAVASRTGRDGSGGSGGSNGKGWSDGRSIVFISQELHEFARNKDCKKLFALHYLTNFYLTVNYFVNLRFGRFVLYFLNNLLHILHNSFHLYPTRNIINPDEDEYFSRLAFYESIQSVIYFFGSIAANTSVLYTFSRKKFIPFSTIGNTIADENNVLRSDSQLSKQASPLYIKVEYF